MRLPKLLERGRRALVGLRQDTQLDRMAADSARIAGYGYYKRWYDGYAVRGPIPTLDATHAKRVSFNFCRPIISIAAGFLAGNPLVWEVLTATGETDDQATDLAKAIWDRSGGERTFLEAAILTGIYGDCCMLIVSHEEGPSIEFLCPDLCFPVFTGHDFSELLSLEIAYQVTMNVEESYTRHEYYEERRAEFFDGDTPAGGLVYDAIPAVWVRNNRVPGEMFGTSDLSGLIELIDQYDHLARRQVDIADYYATPHIVFTGVTKTDSLTVDTNTTIFLPRADGTQKAEFLERRGDAPDIEAALIRIRNAIAEISQVPSVAFGQMDRGFSSISGIGLKILYGPLLDKTRRKQAAWGPALERAMWLALTSQGVPVPLPQINLIWPDPAPVDPKAAMELEVMAVGSNLKSKETAMRALGIEDPPAELEKIKAEAEILVPPELKAAMELQAAEGEEDEEDEEEPPPF